LFGISLACLARSVNGTGLETATGQQHPGTVALDIGEGYYSIEIQTGSPSSILFTKMIGLE